MKLSAFQESLHSLKRLSRNDIFALIVITLIGLIHLSFPFDGDQALFITGASKIDQGGVLYRDFWDLKQPGIYWFYFLAGKLFGFNEIGIHTFELIYMLTFSTVLLLTLKNYYKYSFISSCVPILTVGIYYTASGTRHLTEVEALVGFPMFLVFWFAYKSSKSDSYAKQQLFVSGFIGGIVLLFKLLFLPIILSFWIITLIDAVIRKKQPLEMLFKNFILLAIGISIPLLVTVIYFARLDTLNLLYQTFIEYPPRIFREIPHAEISRLIESAKWFITNYSPILVLGIIGIYNTFKRFFKRSIDLIAVYLISWITTGLIVILLQRQSWWSPHFQLLFVPLGIFAAKGIEVYLQRFKNWNLLKSSSYISVLFVISLLPLFIFPLKSLSVKNFIFIKENFALNTEQQFTYKDKLSHGTYDSVYEEVVFLKKANSLQGDIYVCGNPLYYFISGRNQAIPINGWALELLLPEQWIQLNKQLSDSLPVYIFISVDYYKLITQQHSQEFQVLKNYQVLHESKKGTWYSIM